MKGIKVIQALLKGTVRLTREACLTTMNRIRIFSISHKTWDKLGVENIQNPVLSPKIQTKYNGFCIIIQN